MFIDQLLLLINFCQCNLISYPPDIFNKFNFSPKYKNLLKVLQVCLKSFPLKYPLSNYIKKSTFYRVSARKLFVHTKALLEHLTFLVVSWQWLLGGEFLFQLTLWMKCFSPLKIIKKAVKIHFVFALSSSTGFEKAFSLNLSILFTSLAIEWCNNCWKYHFMTSICHVHSINAIFNWWRYFFNLIGMPGKKNTITYACCPGNWVFSLFVMSMSLIISHFLSSCFIILEQSHTWWVFYR